MKRNDSKIILASSSPQRQKIMTMLGVSFEVDVSHAEESMQLNVSADELVINNALLKAQDVAKRHSEGVVIGADTVAYTDDHQVIGKPADLEAARQTLRRLMDTPQSIYTGVAVIDVATGQQETACEKTKVFMHPMTDEEIAKYHARVSPLDKAGSFDIEGLGSLFIHRIEGCYWNVVGLPVARLRLMLKKFGVSLLMLMMAFWGSGCTTEYNLATKQQETMMYSTEREVAIGAKVAEYFEKQYGLVRDVDVNERVERIFDDIVAVSGRNDIVFFIRVLDDDLINAVSLPGGYVFLFRGLVEKMETDDQFAGVIAHEIAHITAKHGLKRQQASYGAMLLQLASFQAGGRVAQGVNVALTSLFYEHSQQAEFEADRLGVAYMKKAGYDPEGMMGILQILRDAQEKQPLRNFSYWRTHPFIPKRMAVVNQAITGELEFRDYIRLIDAPGF